jgi:hypothetical protein
MGTLRGVWSPLLAALIAVFAAAGFCYYEYESLAATRSQFVLGELQPMVSLLKDDSTLVQELQSDHFTEEDSGILESYRHSRAHQSVCAARKDFGVHD